MQEKRSKELQVKLGTLISITISYCLLRNISITPSISSDMGFLQENLSMFTGMQIGKISPFALGVTPYLLSTLVLSLMKSKFLPNVKSFLENPSNTEKVKKIEYALFLFYCIMQILLLYEPINAWSKFILLIGAITLRKVADKITDLKLINGVSYILAISILAETISSVIKDPLLGIVSLAVMIVLSALYFKGGKWIETEYKNEMGYSFSNDVHISTSLAGVMPLFFSSMVATISQTLFEKFNIPGDIAFNIIYIICIYLFTIYTYFKLFNPKKYVDVLVVNGYSVKSKDISPKGFEQTLKKALISVSLASATALCIFTYLPALIEHFTDLTIPVSAVSLILLISIIIDFINSLKFFNIKTGYRQLAYKKFSVNDLKI